MKAALVVEQTGEPKHWFAPEKTSGLWGWSSDGKRQMWHSLDAICHQVAVYGDGWIEEEHQATPPLKVYVEFEDGTKIPLEMFA